MSNTAPATGWDERRGWAYLVWVGHLAKRPSNHGSHPCDTCKLARMLGLSDLDRERLLAGSGEERNAVSFLSSEQSLVQSPDGATATDSITNVVPFRKPG